MKKLLLITLLFCTGTMLLGMKNQYGTTETPEEIKRFIANKEKYIQERMDQKKINQAQAVKDYRIELGALKKMYEKQWGATWE